MCVWYRRSATFCLELEDTRLKAKRENLTSVEMSPDLYKGLQRFSTRAGNMWRFKVKMWEAVAESWKVEVVVEGWDLRRWKHWRRTDVTQDWSEIRLIRSTDTRERFLVVVRCECCVVFSVHFHSYYLPFQYLSSFRVKPETKSKKRVISCMSVDWLTGWL